MSKDIPTRVHRRKAETTKSGSRNCALTRLTNGLEKAPTESRPLIRRGSDSILPNLSSTGPIFIHLGGRAKRVVGDDIYRSYYGRTVYCNLRLGLVPA
jgi:hypothetical protein